METTTSSAAPNQAEAEPTATATAAISTPAPADTKSLPKGPKLKKIVVAVHGVGKQFRYATIQSVAGRFSAYGKYRVGVPLGNFHSSCQDGVVALRIPDPPPDNYPPGLLDTGFAEIFWANIPDEAVKAADTLEETKAWARTVVERVRSLDRKKHHRDSVNYEKASAVVEEMIETISVLENLLFLTKKCGIGTFDLQSLLTDYVGDIQIVTEFASYRARILRQFHNVLRELNRRHEPEEIHIIAHSEGTVIAFLGLLEAMSQNAPDDSAWVDKVVGFMTIGSPIDKHLVMWPGLFEKLEPARATRPTPPIEWRNYYDYGDPVGFKLDTARQWLVDGKWMSEKPAKGDRFHFPNDEEHDCGFTRYPFPGKAHNDYWEDKAVFDHFIAHVIDAPKEKLRPAKPCTRWLCWVTSWILPYVICFIILLLGTYIFYKPVSKFIHAEQDLSVMTGNVFAASALLAGMTVLARVPRLAKCIWKFSLAAFVFGCSVVIYKGFIEPGANRALGLFFTQHFGWSDETAIVWVLGGMGVLAGIISYFFPRWGLKPIVALLALVGFAVAWGIIYGPGQLPGGASRPAIWPIVLSGAAFLYLWWLAALVFDLVFVWHCYIRSSRALQFLRSCEVRPLKTAAMTAGIAGAGRVA